MLRKYRLGTIAATSAAALGWGASAGQAAVAISIDNVNVLPGGTATVGVYIASTSADVLTGFNLPLDINNDGFVDANTDLVSDLPIGFAFGVPAFTSALYADTGLDRPFPQMLLYDIDAIPTGSGVDVALSMTPTKLFDLVFNVDVSVPVGTVVPLQIRDLAFPFTGVFTIAGRPEPVVSAPTVGSPVFGSITVVAPEPSCIGLMGLGAYMLRRRRARA